MQNCLACQPDLLQSAVPVLRISLSLLHQILRFGDVSCPANGYALQACKLARITLTYLPTGDMSACSSGSPALLPVLQDLWPLLQTMTMVHSDSGHLVLLRDEGVCRGAFDLLSSLVSVLSLSLGAQADLTQILDCVAQGICMALRSKLSAASSALKTVASTTHVFILDPSYSTGYELVLWKS